MCTNFLLYQDIFIRKAKGDEEAMRTIFPNNVSTERRDLGEIYFEFALHFISIVVGKKKFEKYCLRFPMSKFVTVSDETFALLIFENNYERWMSMAVNDHWTSSNIKPAYTSGGNVNQTPKVPIYVDTKKKTQKKGKKIAIKEITEKVDSQPSTTSKYQGWSVQGIQRFNKLYDMISKEQNLDVGSTFEQAFLTYCLDAKESKSSKRNKNKSVIYEVCRHELWDASEAIPDVAISSAANIETTVVEDDTNIAPDEDADDKDASDSSDEGSVGMNVEVQEQV